MLKEAVSKKVWNAVVAKHAPMALFQSWEWGEVEKKLGHKIWRLTWPEGIAQIVKVQARRGTFLHIRHGPIGKVDFNDLKNLAKKEGAWFIRVSPQIEDSEKNRLFFQKNNFVPAPIHAMDAEVCWVLNLDKPEEELLAGMRKTTRYEIKHATPAVAKSKHIDDFLNLYNETSKRHNFTEHKGIREEFETLDCDLFLASHDKQLLAAAIIVYFGDEAIYHHGASMPNKVGASYALQWAAIREAKRRGKKLYNFWGIAPEESKNHPWHGLTTFKTGFGGRLVRFAHAQDLPVSPLYLIPKTIETIRKRIKGY